MTDPQEAYRRWEGQEAYRPWPGMDSPLEDGGAEFNGRLHYTICGIVIGCVIGILATAIFVTGI
jgi:hypothetical protein